METTTVTPSRPPLDCLAQRTSDGLAAVYGASTVFKESDRAAERPLNVYGYSKLLFDHTCGAG
jgi:hypothetical protein